MKLINEPYHTRFNKFLSSLENIIKNYLVMGNSQTNYPWLRKQVSDLLDEYFFFLMELSALIMWFDLGEYDPHNLSFDDVPDMIAGCIVVDLNEIEVIVNKS